MKTSVWQFAAITFLIMLGVGVANAASCAHHITNCGCTITSGGDYYVDNDLTASQGLTSREGCIDVAAKKVKLFTNGHNIAGAGTGEGVGIHLLESAENIFLEFWGTTTGTTVSGWKYGLESQATDVIADADNMLDNTVGILLKEAHNNNINDFTARNNSVYGVWITEKSSNNQINCSSSNNNGIAGVYEGCSMTGPTGEACEEAKDAPSDNFIYDHSARGGTTTQNYGIAIEQGSKHNTISDTGTSGNTVDDLFDGNTNCDKNLWRDNNFARKNESCIK